MVRVLNFFCVALMGLSILALYHVSEKTRVAHMELSQVNRQIAQERSASSACWKPNGSMSPRPARIQQLAPARLGMADTRLGAALLLRPAAAPRRRSRAAEQHAGAQCQRADSAPRPHPDLRLPTPACEDMSETPTVFQRRIVIGAVLCVAAFALVGIRLVHVTLLQPLDGGRAADQPSSPAPI